MKELFGYWKAEVLPGVSVADILDKGADQPIVIRNPATLDIGTDDIAEKAAEIFVPGEGKERTAVGEHAYEAAQ